MGIAMCSHGINCDKRYECYRYMKVVHDQRQSYANFFDECHFEDYVNFYSAKGKKCVSREEADDREVS